MSQHEKNEKPLQVYLDSSDYSIFAGNGEYQISAENEEVFRQLMLCVQEKRIEIRFSAITILECTHLAKQHRSQAVERASVIEELCGQRTLAIHNELHFRECMALFSNSGAHVDRGEHAYNNEGVWYPNIVVRTREVLDELKARVMKELACQPRAVRKKAERTYFTKTGLTRAALETFRPEQNFGPILSREFPGFEGLDIEKLLYDFFSGSIGETEFSKRLSEVAFRPTQFVAFFADRLLEESPTSLNWLRGTGSRFNGIIKESRLAVQKLRELGRDSGKTEHEVDQKVRNFQLDIGSLRNLELDYLFDSNKATLDRRGIFRTDWDEVVKGSPLGALSGMDVFYELFDSHTYRAIKDKYSKLTDSDHGDMQHANYLPYVDVFRADKRMAPMLKSICKKRGLNVVVVRSLPEVLDSVRSRLEG